MTRPDGRYFNVMGGGPDVLYKDLPELIQQKAIKPKDTTPPKEPLGQADIDYYASLQSGVPTEGDWVKVEEGGVVQNHPW